MGCSANLQNAQVFIFTTLDLFLFGTEFLFKPKDDNFFSDTLS